MFIEILVVLNRVKLSVFLFDEEEGGGLQGLDGQIRPVFRFLSMNVWQAVSSSGFSGYSLATLGVKDSVRSMAWSKSCHGGRMLKVCLENTSA